MRRWWKGRGFSGSPTLKGRYRSTATLRVTRKVISRLLQSSTKVDASLGLDQGEKIQEKSSSLAIGVGVHLVVDHAVESTR